MCNFFMDSIFSRESGIFKGVQVMLPEEGRTFWGLGLPYRITIPHPVLRNLVG